jgi:hypothetical protein
MLIGGSCFSTRMMWRAGGKGELYLVSSHHPVHYSLTDVYQPL